MIHGTLTSDFEMAYLKIYIQLIYVVIIGL